jgi:lipopolysaccharide biosynthesis glycosyltransferase
MARWSIRENEMPHENSPTVSVVFGSDESYVAHLAVALCSLFDKNRDLALNVYVLNSNIDPSSWRKIQDIAERYGQKLIDLKVSERDLEGLVTTYHFTLANYYRLFIPEKLTIERALYLDADIVVNGSIAELYNTDLGDTFLAAVCEPNFRRHEELEMSQDAKYFNSGVMVMNLDKWRRERVKDRVLEFVRRKPEAILFVDQCGTNSVVNGHWKVVHPKYNLQSSYLEESDLSSLTDLYSLDELTEAINSPVIIHYTGSAKPWKFRRHHRYRNLYWHYLGKTPFKRYLPEGLTISRVVKWCLQRAGMAGSYLAGDR